MSQVVGSCYGGVVADDDVEVGAETQPSDGGAWSDSEVTGWSRCFVGEPVPRAGSIMHRKKERKFVEEFCSGICSQIPNQISPLGERVKNAICRDLPLLLK